MEGGGAAGVCVVDRSVPVLVPPARPTPHEVLPLASGSVMAGLSTLTSTHLLLFRPGKDTPLHAKPADVIKAGLSQVLVPYYPLAGRIVHVGEGRWKVECDGRGAIFIVTSVPQELAAAAQILPPPPPQYVPPSSTMSHPLRPAPPPPSFSVTRPVHDAVAPPSPELSEGRPERPHKPHKPIKHVAFQDEMTPAHIPPTSMIPVAVSPAGHKITGSDRTQTTEGVPTQAPALTVQVTELGDGGFLVCIKVWKGVCDEAGLLHFLCGWAEMARGKPTVSVLPVWGKQGQGSHDQYRSSLVGYSDHITEDGRPIQVHFPSLQIPPQDHFSQSEAATQYSLHRQRPVEEDPAFTSLDQSHSSDVAAVSGGALSSQRKHLATVNIDIPLQMLTSLHSRLSSEEDCVCTFSQALAAHVWRQRTRALRLPPTTSVRLYFLVDEEEGSEYPKGHYGAFTFNCQVLATVSDLLERSLSYAVHLLQASEATLRMDFDTCIDDFQRLHSTTSHAPLEVLVFTQLPDTIGTHHLDFGALGKPTMLKDSAATGFFPQQVNLAIVARHPHQHTSMLQLIMNNVPKSLINEFQSLILSTGMGSYGSRM